ncbi:GGDEF domain-containing protein [Eubacteriaceae bacterium RF-744-FAT-4]|uniref:GGDEF domain-containing protein n=2 Tax=Pseudoramibacter porci TaxID=2606631 RepID=A0A7X2NEQ9_9FIRM|nr:GGDEF domain-containing protein [Pseudoramibacter porci]
MRMDRNTKNRTVDEHKKDTAAEQRREKIGRCVLLLIIGVLAVCLLAGQKPDSTNVMIQTSPILKLDGAWTRQGKGCTVRLPKDLPEGSVLELGYMRGQFAVKLRGKTIFRSAGDDAATALRWIPLPKGSAGGRLTVQESDQDSDVLSTLNAASVIGSQAALQRRLFFSNLYALIFFLCFSCASAFILYAAFRQKRRRGERQPTSQVQLALFLLCAGVWALTDSQILQLVTADVNRGAMVSVLAFFLMPVFFLQFLETLLPKLGRLRNLRMLFLLNAAVGLVLHTTGLVSVYPYMITNHVLLIVMMMIVIRIFSKDKAAGHHGIRIGCIVYFVCEIAALVAYYLHPNSRGYAWLICLGVFLLSIGCLNAWFNQYLEDLNRLTESELYRKLAYRDELTGLGNRAAYERDWDQVKPEAGATLIMFDINGLKATNDTWGHAFGDQLIRTAAEAIEQVFGEIGTVYRIGGDEFLVLLVGTAAADVSQRLEAFAARKHTMDHGIPVEIAWGMAATDEVPAAALFRLADQRMYQKKREMHTEAGNA